MRSNGYHVRAGTIRWKRTGPDPFQNPRVLISGASAAVAIDYNLTSDKLSPKWGVLIRTDRPHSIKK